MRIANSISYSEIDNRQDKHLKKNLINNLNLNLKQLEKEEEKIPKS